MELEAAEVLILYAVVDVVPRETSSTSRWGCKSNSSLEDFNRVEIGAKFEYCCKSGLLPISWSEVVVGEVEDAETTAEYM